MAFNEGCPNRVLAWCSIKHGGVITWFEKGDGYGVSYKGSVEEFKDPIKAAHKYGEYVLCALTDTGLIEK